MRIDHGMRTASILAGVGAAALLFAAAPAKAGPAATSVRGICLPWIAGAPANTLADAATRNGLKPRWNRDTLESITLPDKAMFGATSFVSLHGDRLGCAWNVGYSDPRVLTLALQDIETITVPGPAGPVRLTKASDVTAGDKRTITYTSPGVDIVVADAPDPVLASFMAGSRDFEVRVRSKRPPVKVSGPPAVGPKGPTHRDEQSCAYKPGSGKIELVMVRQKYTPAGDYDGPRLVLRDGATLTTEQAGYTHAADRAWFKATAPITFKAKRYVKAGSQRVVSPTDLVILGEHDGVVVGRQPPMSGAPAQTAQEAATIWILANRLSCDFQPYTLAR